MLGMADPGAFMNNQQAPAPAPVAQPAQPDQSQQFDISALLSALSAPPPSAAPAGSGGMGIMQTILDAIKARQGYNRDLIEQRNVEEQKIFHPQEPRQMFKDVWNPNDRAALWENRSNQERGLYNTLNDVLGARQTSATQLAQGVTQGIQEQRQAETDAYDRWYKGQSLAIDKIGMLSKASTTGGMTPYQQAQLQLEQLKMGQGEGDKIREMLAKIPELKAGKSKYINDLGQQKKVYTTQPMNDQQIADLYGKLLGPGGLEKYGLYSLGAAKDEAIRLIQQKKSPAYIQKQLKGHGYSLERVGLKWDNAQGWMYK